MGYQIKMLEEIHAALSMARSTLLALGYDKASPIDLPIWEAMWEVEIEIHRITKNRPMRLRCEVR